MYGVPATIWHPSRMDDAVRDLIDTLRLEPHPEGGYFRETFRSAVELPAYGATRSAVTSILFLLPTGARSRRHRVRSDELWLHQQGDPLRLTIADEARLLGQRDGALLQAAVPAGVWQSAEALPGPHGYALVGCVVAPGFDFVDFEMADDDA